MGNKCGNKNRSFFAANAVVKQLDPMRPTHYCEFGQGKGNPADMDSKMYSRPWHHEKFAVSDSLYTKPFYACEYAHAMFNSMGSLTEYNDMFDIYPALMGGSIWEYADQGLWNRRDPNRLVLVFGGGFGEFPNNQYFIHKGVAAFDRSPKPHYPEMKYAYQWVTISATDLANG